MGVLVLAGFVSGPGVASALPLQPAVVRLAVPAESGTTTANLNMRTGPSTGYSVVRVIPRGATVAIVGSSGSWLNVSYAGSTGWSHGDYVRLSVPAPASAESGTTTANLNMRTGPSTGYSVVRVIPRGATVAIVGSSGSWLNVSYAGSTGWSFGNYISISTGGADVARPAPGSIKAIAFDMVAARGWEPSEYTCLDQLWTRESNWNPLARNPSSGAYGIPQALPASKMAVAGADYLTNPVTQMTWGLDYITARYGSPCGAWAHFQQVNWY